MAFSRDGHRLATVGNDNTVRLWDVDTGQPVGHPLGFPTPLTGHLGGLPSVALSPDGHSLATGGFDGMVRLWNADTGQPIGQPFANNYAVVGLAFSPDGHWLATAGAHEARLWNLDLGQALGNPLTGHTEAVWALAFSPDGHRLATAGGDGTVRLWPARAEPDMLCAKLTVDITGQQWRDWVSPDIDKTTLCPNLPTP